MGSKNIRASERGRERERERERDKERREMCKKKSTDNKQIQ